MANVNEDQPTGESAEDRLVASDNNAVVDENGVPQEVDVSAYYINKMCMLYCNFDLLRSGNYFALV